MFVYMCMYVCVCVCMCVCRCGLYIYIYIYITFIIIPYAYLIESPTHMSSPYSVRDMSVYIRLKDRRHYSEL